MGLNLVGIPAQYNISEAALPEQGVIWEMSLYTGGAPASIVEVAFVLGDQLPTTDAMFDSGELLFPGVAASGGRRSAFDVVGTAARQISWMAVPFRAAGRRLIMRAIRTGGAAIPTQAVFVISSIPTEVPDCLLLGRV